MAERSLPYEQLNPDEHSALLDALLTDDLPSRRDQLRPIAQLRSTAEQRRVAFRPYLLRNWIDHLLHVAERGFIVLAGIVFIYWLADGYGRDWLHALRSAQLAQAETLAPVSTPVLSLPTTAPPAVAAALPALPFTTDDMVQSATTADFLTPQQVVSLPATTDPRPQRLLIPAIGLDTAVQEVFVVDSTWQVADYAAGYHNGTALPGNIGNTVMAGHAGLRGAVFKDIGQLSPGDEIIIETGGWSYRYRVRDSQSVWPTQVDVMAPTPTAVLTLITCTNWDTQRLIVVADLVDSRPRT